MKVLGDNIQDGDVILSNHPQAGGSHLPDLTVITPVCGAVWRLLLLYIIHMAVMFYLIVRLLIVSFILFMSPLGVLLKGNLWYLKPTCLNFRSKWFPFVHLILRHYYSVECSKCIPWKTQVKQLFTKWVTYLETYMEILRKRGKDYFELRGKSYKWWFNLSFNIDLLSEN